MIRRVDHVIAVVDQIERVRDRLLEMDCPLVWDGRSREHRDVMVSLGAVKLELVGTGAFDGWPALADLAVHAGRQTGVRVAAFDPGDLDRTITELRRLGVAASDPQAGQLAQLGASPESPPAARWRNAYVDGLRGLLPGLPSFLCQIVSAAPSQRSTPAPRQPSTAPGSAGEPAPNGPIRFVELRVGVPDPAAVTPAYERVLGVRARTAADGGGEILIPLANTPIRLEPGSGLQLLLEPTHPDLPLCTLDDEIPGLRWTSVRARP